ncbi:MAG TPA: ubiquinol-cytochrome c reductase iron-sulfur subunit [Rhizomicrobium sp.]|nr:ubiquinol-cytochrome c reductase iron-sulfur subunit [Rhizomicrobium sp.]
MVEVSTQGPANDAGTMDDRTQGPAGEIKRRDFLYIATGAMAATGAVLACWPFIDQMEPDASALAAGSPITVDLSQIAPGQQILVRWLSHPIFIVHRTPAILAGLKDKTLLSMLRDPDSDQMQQPDYAKNWCRAIRPEYLVLVGICTHLGCIPTFTPAPGALGPSWPGGYLCHCHGSRYDLAGRVFQGVPAPLNLPVPPYSFSGSTSLIIGQNPKGESFSLSAVEQL